MKPLKHYLLIILALFSLPPLLYSCQSNERRRVKEVDINTVPKDPEPIAKDTTVQTDSLVQYTIVDKLKNDTLTSVFSQLIEQSKLDSVLNAEQAYTILAPVNEAWNKLPGGTLQSLKQVGSEGTLANLINNHIIKGLIRTNELQTGSKLKTLQGEELNVMLKDSMIIVEDAHGTASVIIKSDQPAKNGIVHTINAVLIPQ